jgi:5-methylcytosine-specific restriction endonuclease McrA
VSAQHRRRGRSGNRMWAKRKREVVRRDGRKCWICGAETLDIENHPRALSLDHVVGLRDGGSNEPENLRVACRLCNTERAAKARREGKA